MECDLTLDLDTPTKMRVMFAPKKRALDKRKPIRSEILNIKEVKIGLCEGLRTLLLQKAIIDTRSDIRNHK